MFYAGRIGIACKYSVNIGDALATSIFSYFLGGLIFRYTEIIIDQKPDVSIIDVLFYPDLYFP